MFGRSKSTFKPYTLGQRKPRRRFPRWLLWLLIGVVLGAIGVIFVQQEYMPPRLTAKQSAEITTRYEQASVALQQTRSQLEETNRQLAEQRSREQGLMGELERARSSLQPLQDDLELLQAVLPPDPRGGDLQVRAGRFYNREGNLSYHLVLTRESQGKFAGNIQFAVEGQYPNGRSATITLDPVAVQVDQYSNVHGELPLPGGLRARQVTVRVLDANDRMQAMRVINTRN